MVNHIEYHLDTDPACRYYVAPRTWWQRRKHDRARGRSCWICTHAKAQPGPVVDEMLDEMLTRPRCACGLMLTKQGACLVCVHCDAPCAGTRSTCARCRALHAVK